MSNAKTNPLSMNKSGARVVDQVLDNDRRGTCLRRHQPRNHRELRGLTQQRSRRSQVVQGFAHQPGPEEVERAAGAARQV